MAPHKLISLLSNIKNNELTWNQHICSFLLDHGILGVSSSHPKFHKMEQNQDCIYIKPLRIAEMFKQISLLTHSTLYIAKFKFKMNILNYR